MKTKMMMAMALVLGLAVQGENERTAVKPDAAHLKWHAREIMAIVHWGPNTFMNQEWGFGDTPPAKLAPDRLDPAQWVEAMAAAEIKSVVLVAKHHDGFCLWPSKFNDGYSMAQAPGANRNRNVVKEVAEACAKHGLKFGVYLSPWDRNRADYARDSYVEYFHNQWREVLTDYGEVCEIWLDGANGGDGWYGGAKERRSIPGHYYQKPRLLKTMHELQPDAVAFGGHGRWSTTWCGNEGGNMGGNAHEEWWCARPGEDGKLYWQPSEADFPLRQGWFYHEGHSPKPLAWLTSSYFRTVGWGAVMNIGVAPDLHGRVCDADVQRLKEFGDWVRKFNSVDFASGAQQVSQRHGNQLVVTVTTKAPVKINCVDIGEKIELGQRVKSFRVEVDEGTGWREVAKGPTVGWRRLATIPDLTVKAVRVTLEGDGVPPEIKPVRLRWADHVAGEVKRAEDTYSKTGWKIVDKSYGEAEKAIDGKDGTIWHTHPYEGPLPPPQWFAVDMGKTMTVHGFDYMPRQDHCIHGMVDRYDFAVSDDGKSWRKVSSGEFGNLAANPVRQRVKLERPVQARYFRFTGTHSLDKNNHCVVAEIYIW